MYQGFSELLIDSSQQVTYTKDLCYLAKQRALNPVSGPRIFSILTINFIATLCKYKLHSKYRGPSMTYN